MTKTVLNNIIKCIITRKKINTSSLVSNLQVVFKFGNFLKLLKSGSKQGPHFILGVYV